MALLDPITAKLKSLLGMDSKPAPEAKGFEYGWGGAKISAGISLDEHNAALRGTLAIQTAVKMRRTDSQVRAVEKVISLPIRSTHWFIEEPDGAGSAEKEACELLRANLFGGMVQSFDSVISEACLAIYYGFRVPEIVWEERDGQVAIRKIASRNPELLERWLYDLDGEIVGYVYAGSKPIGDGLESTSASMTKYERLAVPLEKSVHFVYDQENENPSGFGLWRSMYPHWYIKQALLKIISIGVERNLLDVPVGKLQKANSAADRTAMLTMLRRWRAAEDAAVVLTEGQELEFIGSQRSLMDAMPFLNYQDQRMAITGFTQFLNLGMTSGGTQALATEQVRIFETCEEANAQWIEETLQQQLIKRWCLLNYGDKLKPPVLKHKPIRSRDITAWTAALNALTSGGFVHATVDDEEFLRDQFELPEIKLEQLKTMAADREKAQKEQMAAAAAKPAFGKEPVKATEDDCGHTFAEGDVEAARAARDVQESDFQVRAAEVLSGIQNEYLDRLRPLVTDANDANKIAQGKPIDKLPDVEVPGRRRYTEFVRAFLWDALQQGRTMLATETGQTPRAVSNRLRQWVTARAEVLADDHLAQLKTAVLSRVLTGLRAEMEPSLIFSAAGAAAIEEFNRNTQSGWAMAAAEVLSELQVEG